MSAEFMYLVVGLILCLLLPNIWRAEGMRKAASISAHRFWFESAVAGFYDLFLFCYLFNDKRLG